MTRTLPVIGADQLRTALRPRDAVEAIVSALRAGLDPAADPPRSVVPVEHGQLLLMPAAAGEFAGVKVATVAPGNAARGVPRIQGHYLLFDAETLSPVALLDGVALTAVRTPAVSVAAVAPYLLGDARPLRVAVFGRGPQAVGHVDTIADVLAERRPVDQVTYLVRNPRSGPVPAHPGLPTAIADSAGDEAERALAEADVVVCATTARTPLFDSSVLRERCVVIAVGSHEPDAREVDGALLARSHVVVEDVGTALREAGDVVIAIGEGAVATTSLIPLRLVVDPRTTPAFDRPVLVKSTGMAWEDLVVATALFAAVGRAGQ